jgi:4-hydroxyphenylpyruvate dioxygenase
VIRLEKIFEGAQDFLLLGTDYVSLCSNAKTSDTFYKAAFGYQSLAYAGLETGRDRASYVLKQDKIRLVL